MKFLICVVWLVTAHIAVATALVQPGLQQAIAIPSSPICQEDWECKPNCFCYKEGERQQRGQCVCTLDLKILNKCAEDRECEERNSQGSQLYCRCYRDSSFQPTGQCECLKPIG